MLQHIRLLVMDLDYVAFDCSLLKAQALRQSLISMADAIPQNVRLPDAVDAEDGYREHGPRWIQHLEIGLNEEGLEDLQRVYALNESRLVQAGSGSAYPGIAEFAAACRESGIALALGAEASRDYLLSVSDRSPFDSLFEITLCTEEFGVGRAEEMVGEIMHHAEVNPSETIVLGTRPQYFQAAHNLDVLTIGCGWGLRRHTGLAEADLQSITMQQLIPALQKADELASRYS